MRNRLGTAAVELAVCLPVLILVVFGSLAATSAIFFRTAVVQSTYETLKEAVRFRGDMDTALARGNAVLSFRNLTPTSFVFDPPNVAEQERGTPITLTVTAEAEGNIFTFGAFAGRQIVVQSTMSKE
jgi:hypothetical protein